jgi:hypothetical protein
MKEILRRVVIVLWLLTLLVSLLKGTDRGSGDMWVGFAVFGFLTWIIQFVLLGIINPILLFKKRDSNSD